MVAHLIGIVSPTLLYMTVVLHVDTEARTLGKACWERARAKARPPDGPIWLRARPRPCISGQQEPEEEEEVPPAVVCGGSCEHVPHDRQRL